MRKKGIFKKRNLKRFLAVAMTAVMICEGALTPYANANASAYDVSDEVEYDDMQEEESYDDEVFQEDEMSDEDMTESEEENTEKSSDSDEADSVQESFDENDEVDEKEEFKKYGMIAADQSLQLYCNESYFNADIYSYDNMICSGSSIVIDGALKTSGVINQWCGVYEVTESEEHAPVVTLPNLRELIESKSEEWQEYEYYLNVNNEKVHEGFMHSTGGLQISGTDFIGDCYMMAEDSIQYSVNTLNDNTDGRVVVYSENGDVNISGSKITINGILAAPNGTVRINADQVTINGRIYASSIELSGTRFNLYASDEDMDLLWEEADVTKIYDFNDDFNEGTCDNVLIENDGVVLDYGNEKGEKVTYEYQAEDEKGLRINVELDPNLVNQTTDKIHYSANIAPKKTTLIPDIEEDSYFTVFNGNLYAYVGKAMYWEDAKKFCEDCGGHLATISSAEENQVLRQLARGCDYTAIGFNDVEKEGDWVWVTGEEVTYTNWNGPEPNNGIGINVQDHGFMYSSGRWDDGFYSIVAPFFCEWEEGSDFLYPAGRNVEYIVEVNGKATPAANSGWECVENENGTTTLVYYAEKLMPSEEIKLDFDIDISENAQGYQTIISDSYCNYYDAMGKGHRIEMGEISFPVKKYVENGTWSVIYDSEIDDTKWSKVWWDAEQAGNSSVSVKVKAYNDEEGEVTEAEVVNGEELEDIQGRYIEIEATLMSGSDCRSPFLNRVMLASEKSSGSFDLSPTSAEGSIVSSDVMRVGGISNVYFMTGGGSEICSTDINWSLVPEKGSISEEDYSFKTVSPYLTAVTVRKAGTYTLTAESACGDTFVSASKKIKVRNIPALEDIEPLEELKEVYVLITMPDYATPLSNISGEIHLPGGEGIKELTIYQDGEKLTTVNGQTFTAVIPEEGEKSVFDFEIVTKTDRTVKKQREVYIDYGEFTVDVTPDKEKYTEGDSATFTFDVHSDSPVCGTTVKYDNNELFYGWNSKIDIRGLSKGEHTVEVHMTNLSGKECVGSYTFTVEELKIPPRDITRSFYIQLNRNTVSVGDEILAQVYGPFDSDWENVTIRVGDEELQHDQGRVSIIADKIGKYEFTATLKKDGQEYTAKTQCYAKNLSDNQPPTAEIKTPKNEEVITEPVDVVGTASDEAGIDSWILKYRQVGSEEYQILAEGTENVEKDVLGHLDTTMLMNGTYEVVLEVTDQGGNIVTTTNNYVVEGNLKVGAMHIGFEDMKASMGGTSVAMNRIYDSRNKEQGEFGYGWTMGLDGVEVFESHSLDDGYEMIKSGSLFSTGYQMTETVSHDVTIAYGDGTSDRFELTFKPAAQALVPISEVSLGYHCVTNQKVKLEIVGDSRGYVSGSELYFYDEDFGELINYKLTTEEGTEIYLNKKKGVYKIVDKAGNVIKVDKDGYHSEDGKSITFKRDDQNRIVTATDPAGKEIQYGYDKNGDLTTVTDAADRTVTFEYDKKHNLMSITDPMGIAVSRNEYDDNGRLIATIDADGNRIEYDYDVEGRTQVVSDRLGNKTVYVYDDNGNVLATTDANGNTTKSTYDSYGNVLSKQDAKGNTTNYSYDKNGNMTTLTDVNGNELKNTYNASNQVTSMSTVDDTEIIIDYDKNGYLAATTDSEGNTVKYTNDKNGNVTSMSDELGQVMSAKYDKDGNVIESTDNAGNRTVNTYDASGNVLTRTTYTETEEGSSERTTTYVYNDADELIQTIDPDGNTTSVERNADGKMTATIDSQNRRTEYEYDKFGNVSKITYADGTSESFEYDAEGRNTKSTDRLGLTVTYSYDKVGNLLKQTDARGNVTSYTYDKNYNVLSITSPTGATTSYTYDSLNRNTSIQDNEGNITKFEYNDLSLQTSSTDAKGNVTRYEYDKNGSRTKIIFADDSYVQTEYDERGRTIWQKDQFGRKTKYTYDNSDRLIAVEQNNGSVTNYTYNQTGNLTSITDANDNTTTYVYDKASRRVKTILADGSENVCKYNNQGQLVETRDYNGVKTTYQYDDQDRLVKQVTDSVTSEYTYDSLGRVVKVVDGASQISYSYNKYGELSEKSYENDQKITYNYDKYGRTSEISVLQKDKKVTSTQYEYDKMNRLTRVVAHDGTATVYTYDENGNRKTATFANGEVLTFTYDELNRLILQKEVDKKGNVIAQYSYTLGKGGERTKVTETGACGEVETSYDYDKAGRLVEEVIKTGEEKTTYVYKYDDVGNRISKSEDGKKTTYTYNSRNQLISEESQTGNIEYTYDANGNLLSKAGAGVSATYKYDVFNRLVEYADYSNKEAYTYDAEGVRRSKKNSNEDIVFVSDTTGNLSYTLVEFDSSGKVLAAYTRADTLISQVRDNKTSYYLYDGHGDVRALLNEDGRITDKYRYNAYGELVERIGETENHFLYTGEYYDGVSDLYYLRARYMSPSTGTFISMDSYEGNINDPDCLHKYLYANGNPVKYNDPSGNMFDSVSMVVQSGIQSILDNWSQIVYHGLVTGMVNMIISAVTGASFTDACKSFVTGFLMGAGLSAIRYFVVGAEIVSLARFYVLEASAEFIFSVTVAIFSISSGNDQMSVVSVVMVILALFHLGNAYGNYLLVDVYGPKGSVSIEVDPIATEGGRNTVLENANYAQKTYNNQFSKEGQRIYSELVGEPITTIEDLVCAINDGKVSVSDIPIEYINRDGNILILNTRSSQALTQAGIPRNQWVAIDRTGDPLFESLLDGQLSRNKLTNEGIAVVRKSGGK